MSFRLLAQASLGLGGLILMGMGGYFTFLRPPLLPGDLRYAGASLTQIQSAIPGFLPWISRVFGVLGGYLFAQPVSAIQSRCRQRSSQFRVRHQLAGWRSPTS